MACSACGRPCRDCEPTQAALRDDLRAALAKIGAKGGASGRGKSKRRDVDYAALGRKGGLARKR